MSVVDLCACVDLYLVCLCRCCMCISVTYVHVSSVCKYMCMYISVYMCSCVYCLCACVPSISPYTCLLLYHRTCMHMCIWYFYVFVCMCVWSLSVYRGSKYRFLCSSVGLPGASVPIFEEFPLSPTLCPVLRQQKIFFSQGGDGRQPGPLALSCLIYKRCLVARRGPAARLRSSHPSNGMPAGL